jgi:hypothetical protein
MRLTAVIALSAALALPVPVTAALATLWSIYWISDTLPCGEKYWGEPMIAAAWSCTVGNVVVSICPNPKHGKEPFDQGQPITIVGFEITQILSVSTSGGYMAVGSGHGGDGADVFAMTGGVGTNGKAGFFPAGTGLPQGVTPANPGYAHIDVYGVCDTGTQRALINILYTSP